MMYSVKEIFSSVQGEGARAGRVSVFCRFAGCNLWTGREDDRNNAVCKFCDTDFVGVDGQYGGKYNSAADLAREIDTRWKAVTSSDKFKYVVLTGGEPLLQTDEALIEALHEFGFEVALETNGTILPPKGIDWICVSPKAGSKLVVMKGDELKLVIPQIGWPISEADLDYFEQLDFNNFYLQPMDAKNYWNNVHQVLGIVNSRPQWNVGLQIHKILKVD